MPKYSVLITRDATESAVMIVDADSPQDAQLAALADARTFPSPAKWQVDDNMSGAPYISDPDDLPEEDDGTPPSAAFEKAAPSNLAVLEMAESFISGFEGDEMQEGVDGLLAMIRAAIDGAPASPLASVVINITGGVLQGASSTIPLDVYTLDFEGASEGEDGAVMIDGGAAFVGQVGALVEDALPAQVVAAIEARDAATECATCAESIESRAAPCDECGHIDDNDSECGQCEGTGTIEGGLSGDGEDEECPVCDGTGIISDDGGMA